MQLERITIQGFKSIREAVVEMRPLNILIGANGSGKSNFIEGFRFLNAILNKGLQDYVGKAGGANTILYYGRKKTQRVYFELSFKRDKPNLFNGYQISLVATDQDSLIFDEEFYSFHDRLSYAHPLRHSTHAFGKVETGLYDASDRIAGYVIDALDSYRIYHFHDTSRESRVKQTGDIDDNEFLRTDAGNLAAFLYFLQEVHNITYRRIVRTIQLVAPFFSDFHLRPSPLNPDKIRLQWQEKGSDEYFNAHALSDGTLRFICLVTLLLQPKPPTTIIIDEPELGLHPFAISLLAELLKSASLNSQIIVSTQSVPFINQFEPEDIIVVDRLDGQSTFKRLDAESLHVWLEDYSIGELWEKNLIGGSPQNPGI